MAQRTNADCTLWLCEGCERSSAVTMDDENDRDVYSVVTATRDAHLKLSPGCTNDLRVVRPQSWYRDARVLYTGDLQ